VLLVVRRGGLVGAVLVAPLGRGGAVEVLHSNCWLLRHLGLDSLLLKEENVFKILFSSSDLGKRRTPS
jgi:hypothetical protein